MSSETYEARLGQVLNDFLDRRARGEPADEADLLAAHPDLADELRANLDLLRNLPPLDPIAALIRHGALAPPPEREGAAPAEPKWEGAAPAEPKREGAAPAEPKWEGAAPAEPNVAAGVPAAHPDSGAGVPAGRIAPAGHPNPGATPATPAAAPSGAFPPPPRARLGPYAIVDVLGRGGMGIVLKAWDESLRRFVAIKLLRPEHADNPAAVARFAREARAAAALRHPNIVTIHAVGTAGPLPYLVMEYVDGPTLADVLRAHRTQCQPAPHDSGPRTHCEPAPPDTASRSAGPPCPAPPSSGPGCPSPRSAAPPPVASPPSRSAGPPPVASPPSRSAGPPCPASGDAGPGSAGPPAGPCPPSRSAGPPCPACRDHGPHRDTSTCSAGLPTEFIRTVFRQLLEALAAAHAAGLIHRDVKPSNILLECRPHEGAPPVDCSSSVTLDNSSLCLCASVVKVKLADFGLARLQNAHTQLTLDHAILGTTAYMSPEQCRGDPHIDHRTDLYSAGVVLYEMLTGRTPFQNDTPSGTVNRIINDEAADPRTLTPDSDPILATVALHLVAKRPEDRLAFAKETLGILAEGRSVHSRRRWPPSWSRARRLSVLIALLGAVSVASWRVASHLASPAQTALPISVVSVDQQAPHSILVQYGTDTRWVRFYQFDKRAEITAVCVVETDRRGRQIVVAGTRQAVDDKGSVLVALDAAHREIWRIPLHSEITWPDCPARRAYWTVRNNCLTAADIDGEPGEEIVVVAHDPDFYPACISIVSPLSGAVRATFWHCGHLTQLHIAPAFFAKSRPALVAMGFNNSLSERDESTGAPETRYTDWDVVSVAMILDPNNMHGLGPPRNQQLEAAGMLPVIPYAYAFLDRPRPQMSPPRRQALSAAGLAWYEFCAFDMLSLDPQWVSDGTAPWFRLPVHTWDESNGRRELTALVVDRHLGLRDYLGYSDPEMPEIPGIASIEYWDRWWRPIVREGRYVEK